MKRYMLDTNMVSYLVKEHVAVTRRVVETPMTALCISAITEGELLFGLAKRPTATQLHRAVREFLRRIDIFFWDAKTAEIYGVVRARLVRSGRIIGALDMLIAAHALAKDAVLVTNDHAFRLIEGLELADWTVEIEPR
jgi:tRNA(fMet)-specific endonuclease VapC